MSDETAKPWYRSKTILLALLEIGVGTGLAIADGTTETTGVAGVVIAVCGAIQAILRTITTKAVTPT